MATPIEVQRVCYSKLLLLSDLERSPQPTPSQMEVLLSRGFKVIHTTGQDGQLKAIGNAVDDICGVNPQRAKPVSVCLVADGHKHLLAPLSNLHSNNISNILLLHNQVSMRVCERVL